MNRKCGCCVHCGDFPEAESIPPEPCKSCSSKQYTKFGEPGYDFTSWGGTNFERPPIPIEELR
jgi:hypothetical protein